MVSKFCDNDVIATSRFNCSTFTISIALEEKSHAYINRFGFLASVGNTKLPTPQPTSKQIYISLMFRERASMNNSKISDIPFVQLYRLCEPSLQILDPTSIYLSDFPVNQSKLIVISYFVAFPVPLKNFVVFRL